MGRLWSVLLSSNKMEFLICVINTQIIQYLDNETILSLIFIINIGINELAA